MPEGREQGRRHPLHRVTTFAAATLVGALALTACGGSSTSTAKPGSSGSSTSSAAPKSTLKVGMAYDIGGRGDQSFNDAAAAGLDKAKATLGIKAQEAEASQGESDSAKEARLNALASAGYNPIIAVGFAYSAAVAKVAKALPNTQFAIIDDAAAVGPNIANLTVRRGAGLVPRRCGRRPEDQDRQRRLHRRRRRTADPQVRGRLQGRCQGRQAGHQGAGQVPHPAAGLLRLR